MTDEQIENIYKANLVKGHVEALKSVWAFGYASKAGTTLTTASKAIAAETASAQTALKLARK